MPPPPPPVTPSPHRFIVKKEVATVRRTPLTQSHTPRPSSTQQFNATPRFNFSSTPRPTPSQVGPVSTPVRTRFSTPAPKPPKAQDVIEDLSDDLPYDLHPSIEHDDNDIHKEDLPYESADENNEYKIEERSPKRRRFTSPLLLEEEPLLLEEEEDASEAAEKEYTNSDHQQDLLSFSLPSIPSPPAHRRPTSSSHHRFVFSTPAPQTSQVHHSPQATFLKPPRFLPPDPSEASTFDPLPEHFSPHRRGHKYIPGGLASEVRDWLTNLSSAIPATKNKDDPYIVRILIDEVSGGGRAGMTLVRGRQVQDGEVVDQFNIVRVMLAGEGLGSGLQKGVKVEVGKVVGIKSPVWEVVVEGEKWGVGVEWKDLS